MLESLPTEILLEIYDVACTDDGTTGRSLSRVSRRICDTSRLARLRSVTVKGGKQLCSFAAALKGLQEGERQVKHLFVEYLRGWVGGRPVAASHLSCEFWESEPVASDALIEILTLVAPTLETLYVVSNIPRTALFVPVALPSVTSLTLYGRINVYTADLDDRTYTFPSLQHLSLHAFKEAPHNMLDEIAQRAPSLAHLTLAPECPSRHLPYNLFVAVAASQPSAFLPSTQRINIVLARSWEDNVWTNATRHVMLNCLKKSAEIDPRFTVLDVEKVHSHEDAECRWLRGGGN